MKSFHEIMMKKIKSKVLDGKNFKKEDINLVIKKLMQDIIPGLQNTLYKSGKKVIIQDRRESKLFVKSNIIRWKDGFDALEYHILLCLELGSEYNKMYRPEAHKSNNFIFDVVIRNHAKSCLIASEILCLLKNGYPDGAESRWRSLHEVAIISNFIRENGLDCAERYWFHHITETMNQMKKILKHEKRLNLIESIPSIEECDLCKNMVDKLVNKYGKRYLEQYGWANEALGNPKAKVTFANIELKTGMDHWRPYYSLASHHIHASSKGMYARLGLSECSQECLLVGQSNSGMVEPAHSTAISLAQATVAVLMYKSELIDSIIYSTIVMNSLDNVAKSFYKIYKDSQIK